VVRLSSSEQPRLASVHNKQGIIDAQGILLKTDIQRSCLFLYMKNSIAFDGYGDFFENDQIDQNTNFAKLPSAKWLFLV
jgi:hypothetical protein